MNRINIKISVAILILFDVMIMGSCKGKSDESNIAVTKSSKENIEGTSNIDSIDSRLALFNCTIIDGIGSIIEDGVILIANDLIEQVGSQDNLPIPPGYELIDLNGNTVTPGFINTHIHTGYNEENLKNWLKAGVTTIRDLGAASSSVDAIAFRDENNNRTDIARMLTATPILAVPGGYGREYFTSIEDVEERINNYISRDVDVIKFSLEDNQAGQSWTMATNEEYAAIVNAAHAGGKKAAVHLTHARFLELAVEIGVDQIGHMVMDEMSEEICKTIVEKGIYWIPTLELWEGVSINYGVNYSDIAVKNLTMFYEAGGKIALGTDFNGFNFQFDQGFPITEVKLMKEAGMSNMDIILAGTRNAAEVCDMLDSLGTIENNKIADLLIVKGYPLEQIEDLQNTYMVIHNGEIIPIE
ncbi:MAG TPA: amidohydrolase family protein [Mobilitalea sp.]|nr:amidohydrolase family protein [Mobilitalea sp.]